MGRSVSRNEKRLQPQNKTSVEAIVKQTQVSQFSGPIPHPDQLAGYEQIMPGLANRIVTMAEVQAIHRQALEKAHMKTGSRDSLLGLIFGFFIALLAIGGGTYCIAIGREIGGSLLSGGGLASVVSVFVYGSQLKRKEREEKSKQNP